MNDVERSTEQRRHEPQIHLLAFISQLLPQLTSQLGYGVCINSLEDNVDDDQRAFHFTIREPLQNYEKVKRGHIPSNVRTLLHQGRLHRIGGEPRLLAFASAISSTCLD